MTNVAQPFFSFASNKFTHHRAAAGHYLQKDVDTSVSCVYTLIMTGHDMGIRMRQLLAEGISIHISHLGALSC